MIEIKDVRRTIAYHHRLYVLSMEYPHVRWGIDNSLPGVYTIPPDGELKTTTYRDWHDCLGHIKVWRSYRFQEMPFLSL